MFYFLIKNLSRVTWTVLAFLQSPITYDVQWVTSVHWQTVRCLSTSESTSNILSFVFSMSWNTISESSFNVKHFADITSPGTSSSHCSPSCWWIYLYYVPLAVRPNQLIPSIILQRSYLNFTSSMIGNYLTALPPLLASSFPMIHFCTVIWVYHWRQGGNTATRFAVCAGTERCRVTGHQRFEVPRTVTDHDVLPLFMECSADWGASCSSYFVHYSQLIYHSNGDLSCIVAGGWYFLTELE